MNLLEESLSLEDRATIVEAAANDRGRAQLMHVLYHYGLDSSEEPSKFQASILDAFYLAGPVEFGALCRAFPVYGAAVRVILTGGERFGGRYLLEVLDAE